MVQLTEDDMIALKGLASVAPQLEALLNAPNQRTDAVHDDDDNARLTRQIAGKDHLSAMQTRTENAWRHK